MKRFSCAAVVMLVTGVLNAAPSTMRFQGRLTDSQGRPITGSPQVSFELYDAISGGNLVWGPSGFQSVTANDAGLFVTEIGPFNSLALFSGAQDLYLQVTIKAGTAQANQVLRPRQRLDAVAFSFHANQADQATNAASADTVPDGSISTIKIQTSAVGSSQIADHSVDNIDLTPAVSAQLIPSGMIAMFAESCPSGWSRFTPLDNRFPLGVASYSGNPGGTSAITGLTTSAAGAHTHTVDAHTHGAGTLKADGSSAHYHGGEGANHTDVWAGNDQLSVYGQTGNASPGTNSQGSHTHTISSDGSWLPPYLGVIYCEKN